MKYLSEFFENAYYHCLHYIVNKRLHRYERMFWAFWTAVSLMAASFTVHESVNSFYRTKASIRVRTDYLDFITPFPAIFFCEKKEMNGKVNAMLEMMNFTVTERRSGVEIENFVRSSSFILPLESNPVLNSCDDTENEYCRFTVMYKDNLRLFLKYIRASCEEIFTSCTFNEEKFDCCDQFLPVDTFEGKCYAVNSFNAAMESNSIRKKKIHQANRTSLNKLVYRQTLSHDIKTNPANLSVEIAHKDVNLWYMGNTNVPSKMYQKYNLLEERKFKSFKSADVHLRVEEVISDYSVSSLEIERRKCKFWYENGSLTSFEIYSESGCEIECLKKAQLQICGCVLHLLPNQRDLKQPLCNSDGIMRMAQKWKDISRHIGTNCRCLSNCHHFDVFYIGLVPSTEDAVRFRNEKSKKRINFIVSAPTVQYVRHTKQEPLDFIVSVGGAITLFIGCSFLSLAQIVYYFVLKPIGDWRMEFLNRRNKTAWAY